MCGSGMKLAGGRSWCERCGELDLGIWRGGGDGGAGARKQKVRGAIAGAMFADAGCASRHPIAANDPCA